MAKTIVKRSPLINEDGYERVRKQLENRFKQLFEGRIDLSDAAKKAQDVKEDILFTRSFAALALMDKAGVNAETAAKLITDGGQDDGIDAIMYDKGAKRIYAVQSKWRKNVNNGMSLSEFTRFRDGVHKVLRLQWDDDNKNLHSAIEVLTQALSDINTSFEMIFADNSNQEISVSIKNRISRFMAEQNRYNEEFITFSTFRFSDAVAAARSNVRQSDIDVQAMLTSFGIKALPYYSVYGAIAAVDVVDWFNKHENKLFSENIRYTIDKSGVNDGIVDTATNNPDLFWYYNNGITAIAEKISKLPMGGDDTNHGVFDVKRISIINGAQTIGSLARARANGANIDGVRVHIRFISLDMTPDGFSISVTSANNTQNEINSIDFVAVDPTQERIRVEAGQMGIVYTYRRGEDEPQPEKGFTVRSAAIAAACASGELRLAVAAKRYVGGLWENSKKEPYTTLFNDHTSVRRLWTIVRVMRLVDATLQELGPELPGRGNLIVTHGNRFIMHLVCRKLGISGPSAMDIDEKALSRVAAETKKPIAKLLEKFNELNGEGYPGNFFKNLDKQSDLLLEML